MSRDFTPGELEDFREESSFRPFPSLGQGIQESLEHRSPPKDRQRARPSETAGSSRPSGAGALGARTTFYERDRAYRLRESERYTLAELGKFRLISTEDLATHAYQNHREEMEQDIRNLLRQGLIRRGLSQDLEAPPRQMLTLTKEGHRLIRAHRFVPDGQSTYHGFLKPKEAHHDADIYRLYQKGAAQIEAEGGTDLRVVLDFELQKKLNRDRAVFGAESRQEIASRNGLQVVGEKIPVPDLRIEYRTLEGEMAYVDLELVTEHYRLGPLAEKVSAGFSLYAPRGEADGLRRVLDRGGLTAGVRSL